MLEQQVSRARREAVRADALQQKIRQLLKVRRLQRRQMQTI